MTSDAVHAVPEVSIEAPSQDPKACQATLPPKLTTTAPVVDAQQATGPLPVVATDSTEVPFIGTAVSSGTITRAVETTSSSAPAPTVFDAPSAVSASVPNGITQGKPQLTVPLTVSSALIPPAVVKSKPKKKKIQPIVTMATAVTATLGGPGTQGENTGRWTAEEHRLFLQGLEQHGKGWKKIASLIKSRTVVQIRTHAQKYFQKLAKARQNGEEGEISMEGRGGPTSVTSGGLPGIGLPSSKRRRQTTGTKRKAITSVVASATREGKNIVAAQTAGGFSCPAPPLPAVAPALAPFVVAHPQPLANPANPTVPSITTSHGSISGAALEDSLYVSTLY
jgi:SHAQKYF class myb-like DNA-binding protein